MHEAALWMVAGGCWKRWLLAVQGRDVRKMLRCAVNFQPLRLLWTISIKFGKVFKLLLLGVEYSRLWLLVRKVLASLRDTQALETSNKLSVVVLTKARMGRGVYCANLGICTS